MNVLNELKLLIYDYIEIFGCEHPFFYAKIQETGGLDMYPKKRYIERLERFSGGLNVINDFSGGELMAQNRTDVSQSSTNELPVVLEVFYDGNCPLCRREIAFLKQKDQKQLICFRDIQHLDLISCDLPKTHQQMMAEIHGRLPDGSWIKGVEVFRRIYDAIGWTWIVATTRWPVFRELLDWCYQVFAKRRLAITGRCNVAREVKQG